MGIFWQKLNPVSLCLHAFILVIPCSAFSVKKGEIAPVHQRSSSSRISTALASTKLQEESVERIRAAVYQPSGPIVSDEKVQSNPLEILTQVADALRMASKCGIDIVLFPEMYLNGGPDRVLSRASNALDRESYELNIVGNLCGDLNVACAVGYAESKHESEFKSASADEEKRGMYNSIAAFHADGSRAGNYRCVTPYKQTKSSSIGVGTNDMELMKGHPLVEVMTMSVQLPIRQNTTVDTKESSGTEETGPRGTIDRKIKIGMMCGNDLLVPEHSRHLVRSGAKILLASASFKNGRDARVSNSILPTRSIENEIPFLFANYVDGDIDEVMGKFSGSSAIIGQDGCELVRAPSSEFGDLPCDTGYLLPCEVGALYAADIEFETSQQDESTPSNVGDAIQNSIEQWDLTPRVDIKISGNSKKKLKKKNGFGREVQKVVGRRKPSK